MISRSSIPKQISKGGKMPKGPGTYGSKKGRPKKKRKGPGQSGSGGAPKFTLGPVTEIKAPTQVSGPFEVTLEEWVTLAEGMQINIRSDGKYHMFEFDKAKDAEDEFVKWNQELEAGN